MATPDEWDNFMNRVFGAYEQVDPQDKLRQQLLGVTQHYEPLHDWVIGEVAYFKRNGFSDAEAHMMAAAEYCSGLNFVQKIPDWRRRSDG